MSELERGSAEEEFVAFPLHCLIAVYHGVGELDMAIDELTRNGFGDGDIRKFIGEEGVKEL